MDDSVLNRQDFQALSVFRQRVYRAAYDIPVGRVTTYKLLAESIGCRSPRAVGQALKHNPFAPTVPCHRVIASDLTIGGFAGRTSGKEIDRKLAMLKVEGVLFQDGCLLDPERLYYMTPSPDA